MANHTALEWTTAGVAVAGLALSVFNFMHSNAVEAEDRAKKRENISVELVASRPGPSARLRDLSAEDPLKNRLQKYNGQGSATDWAQYVYDDVVYVFQLSNLSASPVSIISSNVEYSDTRHPAREQFWVSPKDEQPRLPINIAPMSTVEFSVSRDVGFDIAAYDYEECSALGRRQDVLDCLSLKASFDRKRGNRHRPLREALNLAPQRLAVTTSTRQVFAGTIPAGLVMPLSAE